ncbi:unnamed protein product [Rotaria magnacalcarata]|uniref:UAS domain-containing protein n=2 Tax=Rotaria magnacalcarata TaxID=392030 RepID=A0A814KHE6_9BILA|nr:unnamed protein product [Rotaria magnacalcarata]
MLFKLTRTSFYIYAKFRNCEAFKEENDPIRDDTESSDDDYDVTPARPVPEEYQDEDTAIEAMHKCFYRRYSACPAFYVGSLIKACEAPFSSAMIEERRPVLAYIHNDKSKLANIFCSDILCSATIIEYLLKNYIVWPFDVTLEANRNMLTNIWQEMFQDQLLNDLDESKYPKLIGIKRIAQAQQGDSLVFGYQPKLLLEGYVLVRNQKISNREIVANELAIFKKECDENEQALSYYLNIQARLGRNAILRIVKYITLIDAINAFTINILLLLSESETTVEICDPDILFINTILPKLKPNQGVSLRLTPIWYCTEQDLSRLISFSNIITLSLLNFQDKELIIIYQNYFPRIESLCLWWDNEINFTLLRDLLGYLKYAVKRFEVHCPGYVCPHSIPDQCGTQFFAAYRIEYFLFDLSNFPLPPTSDCTEQLPSCFLITTVNLIKSMPNLQYFQLITNVDSISKLLDLNEWIRMTSYCPLLTKITLRLLGHMELDEEMSHNIIEIQNKLRNLPRKTHFQVIFN